MGNIVQRYERRTQLSYIALFVLFVGVLVNSCLSPSSDNAPYSFDCVAHFSESEFRATRMNIDFGEPYCRKYLLKGWSPAERTPEGTSFNWASLDHASVLLPLRYKSEVRVAFRAYALRDKTRGQPQRTRVFCNGIPIGETIIYDSWQTYELTIPKKAVHKGSNILTFTFARVLSPRELGLSNDPRKLAACFDYLSFSISPVKITGDEANNRSFPTIEVIAPAKKESHLVRLPAGSSIRWREYVPAAAVLRTRFALDRRSFPGSGVPDSVRFSVSVISGDEQNMESHRILFQRPWNQMRIDQKRSTAKYLITQVYETHPLNQYLPQKVTFQLSLDGNEETTYQVKGGFVEPRVVGSWPFESFEEKHKQLAQKRQKNRLKVLLLGFDGMTWDILDPLIARGELPHFKRLVAHSYCSPLQSLLPSKSPMLWTSIATGKLPEKHGILDYVGWDAARRQRIPVTVNLRRTKAIWNILSDFGFKVLVAGWWPSWPAEKVNGYLISDRRGGADIPHQTWPESLKQTLDQWCPPEPFPWQQFFPEPLYLSQNRIGSTKVSSQMMSVIKSQLIRVFYRDTYYYCRTMALLKRGQPDFTALYINGVDPMCHLFWKYYHPSLYAVSNEEVRLYGGVIPGYYRLVDTMLGNLLANVAPDTLIVIVSDHGFESEFNRNFKINMNGLLERLGFLVRDKSSAAINNEMTLVQLGPSVDAELTQRLVINPKLKRNHASFARFKSDFTQKMESIVAQGTDIHPFTVNWESGYGYDVVVNVNYREILDKPLIVGTKVVPFSTVFPEDNVSGAHGSAPNGVLIVSGPQVRHLENRYSVPPLLAVNSVNRLPGIIDVVPTLLYRLNLPLASDMDGRPFTDIFTQKTKISLQTTALPGYDRVGTPYHFDNAAVPSMQDQGIKNQLKALGYVIGS